MESPNCIIKVNQLQTWVIQILHNLSKKKKKKLNGNQLTVRWLGRGGGWQRQLGGGWEGQRWLGGEAVAVRGGVGEGRARLGGVAVGGAAAAEEERRWRCVGRWLCEGGSPAGGCSL
nr:hypothetical protein Iba_chr06cCG13480 [Ipomoea batatas]GME01479.1 hypothetical protein Iba_contig1820CG0010 [Ipomoea batatas]